MTQKFDLTEDIAALTAGEELSEDFKTKAATIFEAAVTKHLEAAQTQLEEELETRLQSEVEVLKEGLVEKIDEYLDHIVEQWMTDNALALENGVKLEIMENFVAGMKQVFTENYIEVPEEKVDLVEAIEEKNSELTASLNEAIDDNIAMAKEISSLKKAVIVNEAVVGLTALDADKIKVLAEGVTFKDDTSFAAAVKTLKEGYLNSKSTSSENTSVQTVVTDSQPTAVLAEGTMSRYVSFLETQKGF